MTARERHEESLRGPEPRSKMVVIATIFWVALTGAAMWAVVRYLPHARGQTRLLIAIPVGSAALYAVVAHQNRLGDRSID